MAENETTTETETPVEQAEDSSQVQETQQTADPQEGKIERIIAQRLGKYAERTKAAEESAAQYRERLARVEGQLAERQAPPPQQQQPQFYTHEQLQTALDNGRITPAAMAAQLAWQQKEAGKQELRQELSQASVRDAAIKEVRLYLDRVPQLGSDSSQEFQNVRRSAQEIAEETGWPVSDPRVQRRALREVFGSPDKLTKVSDAREFDRQHADRHVEMGGGGSRPADKKDDPLKQVGDTWLNYWRPRVSAEDLKRMAAREVTLRSQRRIQR